MEKGCPAKCLSRKKHSFISSAVQGRGFSNKVTGSVTVQPHPEFRRRQGYRKLEIMNFFSETEIQLFRLLTFHQAVTRGPGTGHKLMSRSHGQHYLEKKIQRKRVNQVQSNGSRTPSVSLQEEESDLDFRQNMQWQLLSECSVSLSESCPTVL